MINAPGAPARRQPFGRAAASVFGVLVALALFGALFPVFPGEPEFNEGSTAPRAITAPRDRSYESALRTRALRDQAAAAEPDVLVFDPGIRERQLAEAERQLEAIDAARGDPGRSASARESAIRAIAGTSLSQRAASVLASATDARWAALADELRSSLARTLAVAINEEDLAASRQRLRELLSPLLTGDEVLALGELADPLVVATQVVDEQRTQARRDEARAQQPPVRVTVTRGQLLVAEGRRLTAEDVEMLDALGLRDTGLAVSTLVATALLSAMVGAAFGGYLFVMQPLAIGSLRRLALFALLLLIPALAAKFGFTLLLPDDDRRFLPYAVPLAAAPIAAAVLLDVTSAMLLAVVLAAVAAFVTVYLPETDLGGAGTQLEAPRMWLAMLGGSLAGVYVAARAERLQRYLVAGIASAGAVGAALLVFWLLDGDRQAVDVLWIAGAAAAGGVFSALIAVGAFVLLSRPFGIITRVELMELAQLNRPLLRRLQDEAPGTFQHSILAGNLAERAADRIGADALLVRIGAYYHDVGKLVAPEFFVENFGEDDDPHSGLDPLQSTRVLHQHVTGGIELARRAGLPEAVVQFIPQHHGTRLASYFYRRAAETDADIDPDLFRYPGPKPQSRETALVMLADSSEATVRADADHSAGRIREIIEGTIRERIEEGQLDECDLTLRDLRVIAESYITSLNAVYHPRVEYPEPTERELAERGERSEARLPAADPDDPDGHVPEGPPLALPETTLPSGAAPAAQGERREAGEDEP